MMVASIRQAPTIVTARETDRTRDVDPTVLGTVVRHAWRSTALDVIQRWPTDVLFSISNLQAGG
jgi:hypothetical protein